MTATDSLTIFDILIIVVIKRKTKVDNCVIIDLRFFIFHRTIKLKLLSGHNVNSASMSVSTIKRVYVSLVFKKIVFKVSYSVI